MRGYGQYCPMAKAAELLADRWTLLIVRDLLCGVRHFNALERGLPGISRTLLAARLRRLERPGSSSATPPAGGGRPSTGSRRRAGSCSASWTT
jgi:DNA-binding HxlR family transcriptional regulator